MYVVDETSTITVEHYAVMHYHYPVLQPLDPVLFWVLDTWRNGCCWDSEIFHSLRCKPKRHINGRLIYSDFPKEYHIPSVDFLK